MFIKITKAENKEYVRLLRSCRKDGKVRHGVVLNFGRLDALEN
jgi:ribosomal protein S14